MAIFAVRGAFCGIVLRSDGAEERNMIARMVCTGAAPLLAGGGFFGAAPANPLDPFGIMFLVISGVVWFAWDVIREGFSYNDAPAGNGARLPLSAWFGPVFIKGVTNFGRMADPHRTRTSRPSPGA